MRLKTVRIKNFRALRDVTVDFGKVTTFIGPNGCGKSTVLRALDWFFNGGRSSMLNESDCCHGAIKDDIEVQVTFDQLSASDRGALGKYAPEGSTTVTIWKRRSPDGAEKLSANAKGLSDFNPIKGAGAATAKKELYKDLREKRPDLGLPVANTGPAIEDALTAWEAANTDKLSEVPEELQTNFFGFNGDGKMSGLLDFVLVTADLRASEEAVDSKASIVGRILERAIDRSAADIEVAKIVAESKARQQEVYATTFKDQLEAMTGRLNEVVSGYSPGRSIVVAPVEVELKAPRTTFGVTIRDGDAETRVDRQGHGFQRTLLISSLQVLAQSGAASPEGVICLAIEEPELFQHPIQAQAFAKVLRALAEDDNRRIQVAYATHSPYFVEAKHFDQVRRLTRSAGTTPIATVHSTDTPAVVARLAGVVKEQVILNQIENVISNELSVALFSERALLVEGTTEAAVFSGIADRGTPGALEASGTAVVGVGGKQSLALPHAILTALGIPVYAMFDGDLGLEDRLKANGSRADIIASEKSNQTACNRRLLRYFGLPEEDFPRTLVGDAVAILEDQLESFLDSEWAEWGAACQKLEEATGVSIRKNQQVYRTATLQAEGNVPTVLREILTRTAQLS